MEGVVRKDYNMAVALKQSTGNWKGTRDFEQRVREILQGPEDTAQMVPDLGCL